VIFGKSVVMWLIVFFIAICVFFIAQWLIPLLFGAIGVDIPANIVNILSILIAAGIVYGGYTRG
jgi:hypothetical protein